MGDLSIRVADRISVFDDDTLLARLTDTEDHFTERKSKSDTGGWIRTTVAFANSAPIGYPALLFIGVKDDGTITDNGKIEDLMKSYSDAIARCYPPIYTAPRVFAHNGKSCIAVTIPGSEERPHFAGLAYVRDGTQTREASEEQFQILIAQRLSEARELLKWKGKAVTVEEVSWTTKQVESVGGSVEMTIESRRPHTYTLKDCNQFYVTVSMPNKTVSFNIADIKLSFDHPNNRLKLELRYKQ